MALVKFFKLEVPQAFQFGGVSEVLVLEGVVTSGVTFEGDSARFLIKGPFTISHMTSAEFAAF